MSEKLELLRKQEELLRFPEFNHEIAWELGKFMVERAKRLNLVVAVSIYSASGSIIFQYLPEGTNLLNQNWMRRKFNTVNVNEASSLRIALEWEEKGENAKIHGLAEEDYAIGGGGFPIRIRESSAIAGAVIASNMFHIADHEFVTGSLREFLNCPEAPEFPYEAP